MAMILTADYDLCAPVHRLGQYNAWRLRPRSEDAIDLVWISLAHEEKPAAHRLLPHGEPSIAIRRRQGRTGGTDDLSLVLCGPFTSSQWYRPARGEELIAVRLKPEYAADLFDVKSGEHSDQVSIIAPCALRDACAASLRAAQRSGDRHAIARALCSDLRRFASRKSPPRAPENLAAALLRRSHGKLSCAMLARRMDVSERHLRRRFRSQLGCSPKTYARQLRLTSATQTAERNAKPDWADIATAAGFHDQAHMINEFRAMTGLTPQQIHAERRALMFDR